MPGARCRRRLFPRRGNFHSDGPRRILCAGNGVSVSFTPNTPGLPQAGLATVEEGVFVNGRWVPGGGWPRRHQWAQPGTARIHDDVMERPSLSPSASQKGIQRVTLYRYR